MEPAALENRTVDECNEFVKIIGVVDGSSADKAALKSDDIILSVNGSSVCSKKEDVLKEFIQLIKSQKITSSITLDISWHRTDSHYLMKSVLTLLIIPTLSIIPDGY